MESNNLEKQTSGDRQPTPEDIDAIRKEIGVKMEKLKELDIFESIEETINAKIAESEDCSKQFAYIEAEQNMQQALSMASMAIELGGEDSKKKWETISPDFNDLKIGLESVKDDKVKMALKRIEEMSKAGNYGGATDAFENMLDYINNQKKAGDALKDIIDYQI